MSGNGQAARKVGAPTRQGDQPTRQEHIRLRYRPRRRGDPGTAVELAREFGTTRDHITAIAKGRARTHVQ